MRPHTLTLSDSNPKKRFRLSTATDNHLCSEENPLSTTNLNARFDRLSREIGAKVPNRKPKQRREMPRKLSRVSEQKLDLDVNSYEKRSRENLEESRRDQSVASFSHKFHSKIDSPFRPVVTPFWFETSSLSGSALTSDGYQMPTPLTSPRSIVPFSEPHLVEPFPSSVQNHALPLSLCLSTSPDEDRRPPRLYKFTYFSQEPELSSDLSWNDWTSSPVTAERYTTNRPPCIYPPLSATPSRYPINKSFETRLGQLSANIEPSMYNEGALDRLGDRQNLYQQSTSETEFDEIARDQLATWQSQTDDDFLHHEMPDEHFELISHPTSGNTPYSKPHTMTENHWTPANSALPYPSTIFAKYDHIAVSPATYHQQILSRNKLVEDPFEVTSPFEPAVSAERDTYPEPPLTPELIRHLQRLSSEEARSTASVNNLEEIPLISDMPTGASLSASALQSDTHLESILFRRTQSEKPTLKPFLDDTFIYPYTINEGHSRSLTNDVKDTIDDGRTRRSYSVVSFDSEG